MTSTAVRARSAPEYDLAVVGAGFAGLACARSAALRGLSVLGSAALRLVASSIYFHRRSGGPLSRATSNEEDELRRRAE